MRFSVRFRLTSLALALASTSAVATTHTIFVGEDSTGATDLVFSQPTITIPVGDTITFQQRDTTTIPHNAVSDDGTLFNSGATRAGPWTYVTPAFTTAGTFGYHCTLHGAAGGVGMAGSITVGATPVRLQEFDVKP